MSTRYSQKRRVCWSRVVSDGKTFLHASHTYLEIRRCCFLLLGGVAVALEKIFLSISEKGSETTTEKDHEWWDEAYAT